jgi:hypothetical protein
MMIRDMKYKQLTKDTVYREGTVYREKTWAESPSCRSTLHTRMMNGSLKWAVHAI